MLKSTIIAAALGFALVGTAQAGCVTGAIAGGVVGHMAGGHGAIGAAAGCAIGHHAAKEKQANQANQK